MNKKLIRLTESDLHRIVSESVNRILKEVKLSDETMTGKKRAPRPIRHGTSEIPDDWWEKDDSAYEKLKKQRERWEKSKAKEKEKMTKAEKRWGKKK